MVYPPSPDIRDRHDALLPIEARCGFGRSSPSRAQPRAFSTRSTENTHAIHPRPSPRDRTSSRAGMRVRSPFVRTHGSCPKSHPSARLRPKSRTKPAFGNVPYRYRCLCSRKEARLKRLRRSRPKRGRRRSRSPTPNHARRIVASSHVAKIRRRARRGRACDRQDVDTFRAKLPRHAAES